VTRSSSAIATGGRRTGDVFAVLATAPSASRGSQALLIGGIARDAGCERSRIKVKALRRVALT